MPGTAGYQQMVANMPPSGGLVQGPLPNPPTPLRQRIGQWWNGPGGGGPGGGGAGAGGGGFRSTAAGLGGSIASGVGAGAGILGSVQLLQVAQDTFKIGMEEIGVHELRIGETFKRETDRRNEDLHTEEKHYETSLKRLETERANINVASRRADEENTKSFIRGSQAIARRIEDLQTAAQDINRQTGYHAADLSTTMERAGEDRTVALNQVAKQRIAVETQYQRQVRQFDIEHQRRLEDYGSTVEEIQTNQTRAQEDYTKNLQRSYLDQQDREKELAATQKERIENLQQAQSDNGLDQAIGGLSLLRAMKSGDMIGILSGVRNLNNINRQGADIQDRLSRGGLTEAEAIRQGTDARHVAEQRSDLGTGFARQSADNATRAGVAYRNFERGNADEQTGRDYAAADRGTALGNLDDQVAAIQLAYKRTTDDAITNWNRYADSVAADAKKMATDWGRLQVDQAQLLADARQRHLDITRELNLQLDANKIKFDDEKTRFDEFVKMQGRLREDQQRANDQGLKDLEFQGRLLEQQKKMGEAFTTLFAGMVITNIGQLIAGVGALFGVVGGLIAGAQVLAAGGTGAAAATASAAAATALAATATVAAGAVGAAVAVGAGKQIAQNAIVGSVRNQFGDEAAKNVDAALTAAGYVEDVTSPIGGAGRVGRRLIGPAHAGGGLINEPAMLISMQSGRSLGTMAERGPEWIVPANGGGTGGGLSIGNFNVYFTARGDLGSAADRTRMASEMRLEVLRGINDLLKHRQMAVR